MTSPSTGDPSLDSLAEALKSAVLSSFARQPSARPGFIGRHLLAVAEGTETPLPPPQPGPPAVDDMRDLSALLTGALNEIVRMRPAHDLAQGMAAQLLEHLDGGRRERATRYADPQALWSKVEAGDVVLVRASWLLKRAGFVEKTELRDSPGVWVPSSAPEPLPSRQELELNHPEAILPAEELKAEHRKFNLLAADATSAWDGGGGEGVGSAKSLGAEALPMIS